MKKKCYIGIFLLFTAIFLQAEVLQLRLVGEKNAYALAVSWNGKQYFATPSHVLLSENPPKLIYQNKAYEVSEFYLSHLRDFALLEVSSMPPIAEDCCLVIAETDKIPAEENFYFTFDLAESNLENIVDFRGQSGKLIKYRNRNGLFQGYMLDTQKNSKIFYAITLKIFPNELHKVDFSIIKAEFLKKNLKNSN